MKRVAVIGSGGAGKSTFSLALGERTGLPVIHLDQEFWSPRWVSLPDDEWAARVTALAAADRWIMDGNFRSTMDIRFARADTVVFLDLPRLACAWAVTKRWGRYRGRSRPDMPVGVNETLRLEFLRWIWDYPKRARPEILARLLALPPSTRVVRLTSRRAMREFIDGIPAAGAGPAGAGAGAGAAAA